MIECNKLTRRYGKTLALDHIDLHIEAGELHAFIGPNGAGKTTAMRILATLMRPTSGDALVDGVSVTKNPQRVRQLVGYMPDFFGVYDNLKAWEYLDLYAGCMGIGEKDRRHRIEELLDLTALSDKREAYVDGLSRGMKQRLCLARAMLHDPALLILDEPASGMDPRARSQMQAILSEIGAMGKTVLISSHILPELATVCTHATILERGRVRFCGSIGDLETRMNTREALTIRLSGETDAQTAARVEDCVKALLGVCPERTQADAFRVACGEEQDAALLAALVGADVPVCDFHSERVTLERVFLEVTRDETQSDL